MYVHGQKIAEHMVTGVASENVQFVVLVTHPPSSKQRETCFSLFDHLVAQDRRTKLITINVITPCAYCVHRVIRCYVLIKGVKVSIPPLYGEAPVHVIKKLFSHSTSIIMGKPL